MPKLAKSLTMHSISEMSAYEFSSDDENGILFAVITGDNQFQMAMWFKNSTATVDNQTIFNANGGGRWHLLGSRDSSSQDFLAFSGDTIPTNLGTNINLLAQKKTDGTFDIKAPPITYPLHRDRILSSG